MKKTFTSFLLGGFAGLALSSALAASPARDFHAGHGGNGGHGEHGGHGHEAATVAAPAKSGLVDGVVKRIDRAGGKITVAHGPLTGLGMPPMTMAFRVRDSAWLDRVRVDDKIRFVAELDGGALIIVYFEAAK
ncbi:MAG: copper-binding protein [Candidatus Accumulibacter sp.]|nr:copper-binding protein [Accumulibacter sp.]